MKSRRPRSSEIVDARSIWRDLNKVRISIHHHQRSAQAWKQMGTRTKLGDHHRQRAKTRRTKEKASKSWSKLWTACIRIRVLRHHRTFQSLQIDSRSMKLLVMRPHSIRHWAPCLIQACPTATTPVKTPANNSMILMMTSPSLSWATKSNQRRLPAKAAKRKPRPKTNLTIRTHRAQPQFSNTKTTNWLISKAKETEKLM